jgi:short-subunit dehydrogenase
METRSVLGKGRIALVTGASRGIGPLIAQAIAKEGNHVLLTGRSEPELAEVARAIKAAGGEASVIPADLTTPGQPEALVNEAEHRYGAIDLLVNNAGGDPQRLFDAMTVEENLDIVQLNLLAPLALSHAVLFGMLQRGRGHIVNISAIAGRVAFPFAEAYAAAKDGLIGFTRVLRNDYHERGVSASVLILGPIGGAGQGQRTTEELDLKLPRFAVVPAVAVANAVVKAVKQDKTEIVLMPGPGRLLKATLDLFPGLGPAMNRASGSTTTMKRVIEYRSQQRALSHR